MIFIRTLACHLEFWMALLFVNGALQPRLGLLTRTLVHAAMDLVHFMFLVNIPIATQLSVPNQHPSSDQLPFSF